MSHYRKVDVRIWNDAKFNSLPILGKLGFMMLLTHPQMNSLGAMRGTVAGLAEELDVDTEDLREGLTDAIGKSMLEHDPVAKLFALPNWLRYNPPESVNVVKSWAKVADYMPECDLKGVVIQRAVALTVGLSEAFRVALPFAHPDPQNIEHRAQSTEQRVHNRHIQGEGTSQGKAYTRETVDDDGVVHEHVVGVAAK
jgi:hypothetical protein